MRASRPVHVVAIGPDGNIASLSTEVCKRRRQRCERVRLRRSRMEQVWKVEYRLGDTDCCRVHKVWSRGPVMTDSDRIVAGDDLSCFRITWELRGYRVNCIGLVGAD